MGSMIKKLDIIKYLFELEPNIFIIILTYFKYPLLENVTPPPSRSCGGLKILLLKMFS